MQKNRYNRGFKGWHLFCQPDMAQGKGFYRSRFAPLEKCQNSPPDCFSVAPYLASLGVRSHFWFEFHLLYKKEKTPFKVFFFLCYHYKKDVFCYFLYVYEPFKFIYIIPHNWEKIKQFIKEIA